MPYIVSDEAVQAVNSNVNHVDVELAEVDGYLKGLHADIETLSSFLMADLWLVSLSLVVLVALLALDVYKVRKKHLKHKAGVRCGGKEYSENLV
jgi:hypothetical protein